MELLGGLGPAWAAKEQKGRKDALDFHHFGVHFGSFWHHFGGTLRDVVVCCGALCHVVSREALHSENMAKNRFVGSWKVWCRGRMQKG